jgi:hypothetical protein
MLESLQNWQVGHWYGIVVVAILIILLVINLMQITGVRAGFQSYVPPSHIQAVDLTSGRLIGEMEQEQANLRTFLPGPGGEPPVFTDIGDVRLYRGRLAPPGAEEAMEYEKRVAEYNEAIAETEPTKTPFIGSRPRTYIHSFNGAKDISEEKLARLAY